MRLGERDKFSVRWLLTLLAVALALPLIILLALVAAQLWRDETENARLRVSLLAAESATKAAAALQEAERLARHMASRPLVRALDVARCDPALAELQGLSANLANLGVVDVAGNPVCSVLQSPPGGLLNVGDPSWLAHLKASKGFVVGAPQKGDSSGRWFVVTAYPIMDDAGIVTGAALVVVDVAAFQARLNSLMPTGGVMGIIDGAGRVIARTHDPDTWVGRDVSQTALGRVVVERKFESQVIQGSEGDQRLYAFEPIGRSGWTAVAGIPTEIVYRDVRRNVWQYGGVAILTLLIAVLLARAIYRRIAIPLELMSETAKAIAGGDMNRRSPEIGPAEVVQVASTFNRMMDLIPEIQARLQVSEDHYRQLFEVSPDAIRVICDGRVVLINPAGLALYGIANESQIIGSQALQTISPEEHERVREAYRRVLEEKCVVRGDYVVIRRVDGTEVNVESIMIPFSYQGRPAILAIARDQTARREAVSRIRRLGDLKDALSRTNEAIVHEQDWQALCNAVCRIAVEQGKLLASRICIHDAATDVLVEFASHGPLSGGLELASIPVVGSSLPSALVFRSGCRHIINDMADVSLDPGARNDALAHGIRSAATFPLRWDGTTLGTFAVFSQEPDYFDDELVDVLEKMAANLAFARAKQRSDAAVIDGNARLASVVASAMDAIISVDRTQNIIVFNQAAEAMFGIPASVAIGT